MPRARTTKVLVGFRINAKLLDRLESIAERLGRNRSELFDRAVEEFVARREAEDAPPAKPRPVPSKR